MSESKSNKTCRKHAKKDGEKEFISAALQSEIPVVKQLVVKIHKICSRKLKKFGAFSFWRFTNEDTTYGQCILKPDENHKESDEIDEKSDKNDQKTDNSNEVIKICEEIMNIITLMLGDIFVVERIKS